MQKPELLWQQGEYDTSGRPYNNSQNERFGYHESYIACIKAVEGLLVFGKVQHINYNGENKYEPIVYVPLPKRKNAKDKEERAELKDRPALDTKEKAIAHVNQAYEKVSAEELAAYIEDRARIPFGRQR